MDALLRTDSLDVARRLANEFQLTLEPTRRKQLGQFFTGLPLSRLVASLSVHPQCQTVIDPMSGHGDLLDAALERACAIGASLHRVDGIDIDTTTLAACESRLQPWATYLPSCQFNMFPHSAFDNALQARLDLKGYDLVITNPPYVRYQSISKQKQVGQNVSARIRESLFTIVETRIHESERPIWKSLVSNYSGLADLSIPSWLLAAMLTKPGG